MVFELVKPNMGAVFIASAMGLKMDLRDGKIALGTWITINHPDVVDALSDLRFDWLCFDLEHAPIEPSDLESLLMPLRGNSPTPVARLPWNDQVVIKKVLDMGIKGLIVPLINTRQDAENFVRYSLYPPRGVRGVGPRRCIRYGEMGFLEYYRDFESEELVLLVQIETQRALENLDEIASTQGLDGLFIGPLDLTVNLGIPMQYGDQKFVEAKKKVLKACERHDVAPGIYAPTSRAAEQAIDEGFRLVAISSDVEAMKNWFKEFMNRLGRL